MRNKNKIAFCLVLFIFLPVLSFLTGMFLYDLSFASGTKGNLVINGSEKYGLRVEHSANPFVFENLYPGYPGVEDEESSTIVKISNMGSRKFTLLIEKKLMPNDEGELILYNYEGLKMNVVEHGTPNKELYSGPLKELNSIKAGTVSPGAGAREFAFSVFLDKNAGNELQGKSIDLQWIFTATGTTEDSGLSEEPQVFSVPSLKGKKAALNVYKFYDADRDGVWDEGEEEIENWTVYINGDKFLTPVNLELEPGEYAIAEELMAGWLAGTPTEYVVDLKAGENRSVSFGNFRVDGKEEEEREEEEDGDGDGEEETMTPEEPPEEKISDPELPETGEFPPAFYYGLGFFLVLAGLMLGKCNVRDKLQHKE